MSSDPSLGTRCLVANISAVILPPNRAGRTLVCFNCLGSSISTSYLFGEFEDVIFYRGSFHTVFRGGHIMFFLNKSGRRATDYIKKKISPKGAQRYKRDHQPRRKTNSTKRKSKNNSSRSDWDIDANYTKPKLNSKRRKREPPPSPTTTKHRQTPDD